MARILDVHWNESGGFAAGSKGGIGRLYCADDLPARPGWAGFPGFEYERIHGQPAVLLKRSCRLHLSALQI